MAVTYIPETDQFPKAMHVHTFLCHVKEKELHHLNTGKGQPRRFHVYDHLSAKETTIICKTQKAKKEKTLISHGSPN